ncbi:MAG: hypothetical protein WAN70_00015, partial [Terriglobales bacterium]
MIGIELRIVLLSPAARLPLLHLLLLLGVPLFHLLRLLLVPLFHLLPSRFAGILFRCLLVFLFLLCGQLLVIPFLLRGQFVLLLLEFLVLFRVPCVWSRRTGVRLQVFRIAWNRRTSSSS